jgi:hypothetical protein
MDVFDKNGKQINIGMEVSYQFRDKVRFAEVNDITGDGRLYCDDNLLELLPDEVTIVLVNPVEQLEEDMRRYLYDRMPDRRITCLTKFQERMGYKPWAERQVEKSEKTTAQLRKDYGLDPQ